MKSASFLRSIILSWVLCLVVPYFSTLSHKGFDFRKNVTEHKERVLSFSTTYVSNISYSKKNSARCYHKCKHLHFYTFISGNPSRPTSQAIYVKNMHKPCMYIINKLVLFLVRDSVKYMFCIICAHPSPQLPRIIETIL
jgi:hypothetical protein